jgi:hypothetical protein
MDTYTRRCFAAKEQLEQEFIPGRIVLEGLRKPRLEGSAAGISERVFLAALPGFGV